MKKRILLAGLLASVVILSGCSLRKNSKAGNLPEAEPTPVPTRPIEQSIKERPYVTLLPTADRHWVTMEIKNIPKGTTGIDYDLIYLADFEGSKIERGVSTGGVPAGLSGATEYSKKILFGSASCTTGVCKYKYDENVNEGTLAIKLVGSGLGEKFETAYRIQKGKEAAGDGLTAGDGVFSLKASLPANTIYLTISTIGVPSQLPAGVTPKSSPYAVFPAVSAKTTVSFKTDLTNVSIYAYDGKSWKKLTASVSGGIITAEAAGASLFILTQ